MVQFKKGERVKFLNDVGQGEIVRFQDRNIAVVLNDDGFEIPVLISELLKVDDRYNIRQDNLMERTGGKAPDVVKTNKLPEKEPEDDLFSDGLISEKSARVYFAIVPVDQKNISVSNLDTYLINDSNFRILYTLSATEGELQALQAYGNLESNTKIKLMTIPRDNLGSFEYLTFQVIFFGKGSYYSIRPVNKTWNLKPARFYKQNIFTENDFFHSKAFIYEITLEEMDLSEYLNDTDIEKAKKEKDRPISKQSKYPKTEVQEEIEVVDLHIEALADDYKHLSNAGILEIQMGRFTTALEGGIIAGAKRMIFIHGIGNGRLKHEVCKTLDRNYPKLKYQDASFKEYGYGATMVIIK